MSKDDSIEKARVVSIWRTPRLIDEPADQSHSSDDIEAVNNSAYNEARSEGYAAGIEAAKRETEANRELLNGYLKALSQPFEEQNSQLAEHIASLAGKIAKSLVEKELSTDKESLMSIVKTAVNALGDSAQEITIHLHPESADFIRKQIEDDDERSRWHIIDDQSMKIGDCSVSCDDSTVESDLDDRIDLIIAQYLEKSRKGSGK